MKKIIIALASALTLAGCSCHRKAEITSANDPQEVVEDRMMTGAYTKAHKPSEYELTLFNETYKGEAELAPYSVATQVVAGTNYAFACKDSNRNTYKVVIYRPLPGQGEPVVTSIVAE